MLKNFESTGQASQVDAASSRVPPRKNGAMPLALLRLTLICLALAVQSASAAPLSPPEMKALLERIREKRNAAPHVQADFHEEKVIRLMNKPISTSGKVWFQAPNKFRREVKGNSPSVMVSDGQQLWIYYPNFKSAEHYSLGKRGPLDAAMAAINTALNLENVETTFRISGSKANNGYDLELLPRGPSTKRLFQTFHLHINEDLLAERTEMLQPNGDRILTIYSNQTRAPIPSSMFEFTPPAGTEISTPLGR
jgi:outer membrane lipoprotein carrier protein